MKTILMIAVIGLLSTGVFAQQNKPASKQANPSSSSSQQSNVQQTGANQTNTNQNNKQTNRNDDRAIGNKNDKPLTPDTAQGGSSSSSFANTPEDRKDNMKPDPTSTNTNTPNSTAPSSSTGRPDPSTEYNRSSNGGIGVDTVRNVKKTTVKQNNSSRKGKVVSKAHNNVPTQQTDEESDRKDAYRKGKPQYEKQ